MTFDENWGFIHKAKFNLNRGRLIDVNEACFGSSWNKTGAGFYFTLFRRKKCSQYEVKRDEKKWPTLCWRNKLSLFLSAFSGKKFINNYRQTWGYIFIHLFVDWCFCSFKQKAYLISMTSWKDGQWAKEEPIKCWCGCRNFNLRRQLGLGRRLHFLSF